MSRYRKAAAAFEAFSGHRPTKVRRRPAVADRDVIGWQMGPVVGIAYEARRDGKTAQYFHEFAKAARPNLVASEDGKQLFISDGKYTVTDRGIEDMPELFIVNPSARRKPKGAKRMAATRRNAKGRFVKGGASRPKRRRAATRQVAVFRANPSPRKRKRRAASAPKARRRTYRRNPSGRSLLPVKGLGQLVMPAVGVGAGAVGVEYLMGYLPIPAAWKSGVMRHVTKGVVGLAAGWGIAHFLKQKKLGFYVSAGAIVIAAHDAIKEFIANRMPDVAFGQYVRPLSSQFGGMGYTSPAMVTAMGQYVEGPTWPAFNGMSGVSQAYDQPGGETDFRA